MNLGDIGKSIPKSWRASLLTDLVTPKQWKTIATKNLLEEGYGVYGANGKIGFYSTYTHEKPTLMITCRGATCGNLHISDPFSYINGNAMALDGQLENYIGIKFLYYGLKARGLGDTISGSAQPQITGQGLSEVYVPLPPLAEQKVIADKLDSLLAQVETIKARLDSVPDILKRFRQSVLAAVVSGRLSEEWRKLQDGAFPYPQVELGKIVEEMRNGLSAKPNEDGVGEPILRISSVRSLSVNQTDIRFLDVTEVERDRYSIKQGDLLFTRYNGSIDFVGVCGIVDELEHGYLLYPDKLIRVRVNPHLVNAKYLEIFSASHVARAYVESLVKSTSGQKGISGKDLKLMLISLPELKEQTEIVRSVEELFAFADAVEQKAQAASERVNKLTQSILAKAFRGELTADWRAANSDLISGENSAEALLEKIKAEREALNPKKKTRAGKS